MNTWVDQSRSVLRSILASWSIHHLHATAATCQTNLPELLALLFGDKSQLMHYDDFLIIVGCFDEDDDGVNILKRSITVYPLLFWDVVG